MLLLIVLSGQASAHQWTPTYPTLEPSYVSGVLRARMLLYNARSDISYFQIDVFDDDWNSVPFATTDKLVNVNYLSRKTIDIHIREKDKDRVRYFCTSSRSLSQQEKGTIVTSRICSKIKS